MVLAIGISFFLVQIQFDSIEAFFYDLRIKFRPTPSISGRVATVALDIKTQEALQRTPEASDYIEFFKKLKELNPVAVVYLQNMEEIVGSYEELEALAESVAPLKFYAIDDGRLPEEGLEDEFR